MPSTLERNFANLWNKPKGRMRANEVGIVKLCQDGLPMAGMINVVDNVSNDKHFNKVKRRENTTNKMCSVLLLLLFHDLF